MAAETLLKLRDVLWYFCITEPRERARLSFLGECSWTMRVDNTFGQPAAKA